MKIALFRVLFFLFGCALALPGGAAEGLRVQLVLSDGSAIYQNFRVTFERALSQGVLLNVVQRAEEFETVSADLIVTVGVKAAELVAARSGAPMLATMIPRSLDLTALRARNRTLSVLYLDQPWHRQVQFLRVAFPDRRRIGVLHSAESRMDIAGLRGELSRHGGSLTSRILRGKDSLFADMDELLSESEVLLAVPDSAVYNGNTIRNILLASYRRGIPLVGFSSSYVKAGALCAIFSTPEQIAVQAAEMILTFSKTSRLPDTQYPARYSVAVNQEVARTLGIFLPAADELYAQIERSPGGRDDK